MEYRRMGRTGPKVSGLCLGGAGRELDEGQLQRLDAVSRPRKPYPKNMERHMKARRDSALKRN